MKAVLIIDMLEDYFTSGPLRELRGRLCDRINRLTDWARNHEIPIIWVRQEFRDDLKDAFPVMRDRNIKITIAGTPGCLVLAELEKTTGDHEVLKKRYSAFFETNLEPLLSDLGITELLLAGINTHACIRAAAIDAYQRDLHVTIIRDCVASYDNAHHDMTLQYLGQHIANVLDIDTLTKT